MGFENMKKDKDFQKWCFETELVMNKEWFNLDNGSGDEVYIAYEAWIAGQQSKQAEIDALQEKISKVLYAIAQSELHGDRAIWGIQDEIKEILK